MSRVGRCRIKYQEPSGQIDRPPGGDVPDPTHDRETKIYQLGMIASTSTMSIIGLYSRAACHVIAAKRRNQPRPNFDTCGSAE